MCLLHLDSLLESVLRLADEYQMGKLKAECEGFMLTALKRCSLGEKLHYYLLAQLSGLQKVEEATRRILVELHTENMAKLDFYDASAMGPIFLARARKLEHDMLNLVTEAQIHAELTQTIINSPCPYCKQSLKSAWLMKYKAVYVVPPAVVEQDDLTRFKTKLSCLVKSYTIR